MTTAGFEFGVCLVRHDGELAPHELARAAEVRGFDIAFLPENSHVPVDHGRTVRKVADMRRLARFHDPFVGLAACAAVTTRIRLGTSVCLLTQREPGATARAVDSLEALSGGRTVLGVAGGFIREAMENHGVAFRDRWTVVRERVAAMRAAWRADPARRDDGPPVWIGSNSRQVPARVAAYADGWMTRHGLYPGDAVADLERACDAAGRRFETLSLVLMNAPLDAAALGTCFARGYRCAVFTIDDADADAARARLDRIAALRRTLHLAGAA